MTREYLAMCAFGACVAAAIMAWVLPMAAEFFAAFSRIP